MSNLVSVLVYHRKFGSGPLKAVAAYMADKASDNGAGVFCSKGTIAAVTELSRSKVYEAINELIERGLIAEVGHKPCKRGFTVVYDMNLPAIFALPETAPMPEGWRLTIGSAASSDPSATRTRTRPPGGPVPVRHVDINPPFNPPLNQGGGEEGAGEDNQPTLVQQIGEALGFNSAPNDAGWSKYWRGADADVIASKWVADLGLTELEVIKVAVANMRQHNSPANGPQTLTRHMQDYAAAKNSPPFKPTEKNHEPDRANRSTKAGSTGRSSPHERLAAGFARAISARQGRGEGGQEGHQGAFSTTG